MAQSICARTSAPIHSPVQGNPDPIQTFAQAHNGLTMAIYYLRQPQPDPAAARAKAVQALAALRNLSLSLEA